MDDLRSYLGAHSGLDPLQLHKEEVAALVLRAGRKAGLIVRTEIPVRSAGTCGRPPTMDCGWFCARSNQLLVAWEFDGRDVADIHLTKETGNVSKFRGCDALLKIQVLYAVKNDLTAKPPSRRTAVQILLQPLGASVHDDAELMRSGGIEALMKRALQFADAVTQE